MTAGVWVRGLLQDHYRLDSRSVRFFTGGLNEPGLQERIRIAPAPGYRIEPIGAGETLSDLLRGGAIDAVIAPQPPACFGDPTVAVRRLFAQPDAEERAFFARTGIFPIMHLLAVRREVLARDPGLAAALFEAFTAARDCGYRQLDVMARAPSLPLMLPWLAAAIAQTRDAMGADPWPYGFSANRETLEALCRYSHQQGLSSRLIDPAEMFPQTLLQS